MMARRSAIPLDMRKVRGRFERWRKAHTGRLPIPEGLWRAAAELAQEHGVCRTAQVLRLEYGKLRRLTGSVARVSHSAPLRLPRTSFVELRAPQTMGVSECVIELEGPRWKVRIQWKGTAAPDLAGLSRALWEPA